MPHTAQERRLRALAKSRGIASIRTKDVPGSEYVQVYVLKRAGDARGTHRVGNPGKGKGK